MTSHDAPGQYHTPAEGHHPHVTPLWVYWSVWAGLMFFTVVTVAVAYLPFEALHVPMALLIATIKASLVALFFMHLLYDEKFNLVLLISTIAVVVIFFAFTLMDPFTRGRVNQIERYPIQAEMGAIPGMSATPGASPETGVAPAAVPGAAVSADALSTTATGTAELTPDTRQGVSVPHQAQPAAAPASQNRIILPRRGAPVPAGGAHNGHGAESTEAEHH